jgi:hypothetical protein
LAKNYFLTFCIMAENVQFFAFALNFWKNARTKSVKQNHEKMCKKRKYSKVA